jgi:hypothetical protein
MARKKPTYKPGKYQYIVRPTGPVIRIEELDLKDLPALVKPRTLHSTGGLIKGKPKLTKKGWK